jgi:hypothetical protein
MASPLQSFFEVVLHSESKTYDDYNYYNTRGLNSYLKGISGTPYPLLKKPLSQYTLGEIMSFQGRDRDNIGQLYATGRYQIIPVTLAGAVNRLKLPSNKVYDQQTQDLIGYNLIESRPNANKYIKGLVPDTKENLEKAALDIAKEWSSVGVPYAIQGAYQRVEKNQSYYQGGGDRGATDTIKVQNALKMLRQNKDKVFRGASESGGNTLKKKRVIFFSLIGITLISLSIYAYVKVNK